MKRSAELRGLSDDHHRALVLAKRAKETTTRQNDNGVKELWAEIRREWNAGLAYHFAVEEAHLLPPLRAAGGDALASRLERDHAAIRNYVLSGPFDETRLRQFGERLSDHVRFEERELFPFAEAKLARADLDRIARVHREGPLCGGRGAIMVNAAIDMLVHEHKVILKVVEGLRQAALLIRGGNRVDTELLREAVAFMREFADRCHHAKEEDVLFPALVAHGVPLHGCPIDALLHEHEKGRHLVTLIRDTLDAYASGVAEAGNTIADAIDGIVKLYPNHIWKEDDMVFPMVERLFSETDRLELYKKFQEVESKNPPGTHERFHTFAERLSKYFPA